MEEIIEPCNAQCSFCFLNYATILSENNLFKSLEREDIGKAIKSIHHQVKSFSKGDMLLQGGARYENLYIVVEGEVIAEMIDFDGHVLKIEQLRAPNTIAGAFLFGKDNNIPVTVTAVADTKIISLHKDELLKLFQSDVRIMTNFLNMISNRAQFLSGKVKMLGFQSIKGKLAHFLMQLHKSQNSTKLVLNKTQNELAEMFGVARPSLSRALRELHSENIIHAKGKNVELLNIDALKDFLR